jgi:adenine-specific DNA-methyltransferase
MLVDINNNLKESWVDAYLTIQLNFADPRFSTIQDTYKDILPHEYSVVKKIFGKDMVMDSVEAILDNAFLSMQDQTRQDIIKYLESLRIIDPACGSGAFPMGILQKMVDVIHELDPAQSIFDIKTNILKECIYGCDLLPIAVEISRLRAWLSLIVDEPNDQKPDLLPNLEFKFVCANSLVGIQKGDVVYLSDPLVESNKQELDKIRKLTFEPGHNKAELEQKWKDASYALSHAMATGYKDREYELVNSWNPFQNKPSDFFDSMWMFGVESFDLVLGNPPYVQTKKGEFSKVQYPYSEAKDKGKQNLYKIFTEHAYNLLSKNGLASYILQSSLMCDISSQYTRELLLTKTKILEFVEFPKKAKDKSAQVFDSVLQGTCIVTFAKTDQVENNIFKISVDNNSQTIKNLKYEKVSQSKIIEFYPNGFYVPLIKVGEIAIIEKMRCNTFEFSKIIEFSEKGDINLGTDKKLITEKYTEIKLFRGGNAQRYKFNFDSDEFILKSDKTKKRLNRNVSSKLILSQQITGTVDKHRLHFAPFYGHSCIFGDSLRITKLNDKLNYNLVIGLLNSKILDWFFRKTSTNNNVNGYEIEQLPIPILDTPYKIQLASQIEGIVEEILAVKNEKLKVNNDIDTTDLESQIDALVYELYELTQEEIAVVES